ncbi:MAG: hypothetical protein HC945_04265 [Nitrosarchaeum sp.]|nr:hypothetical protein [Nitrosarchaeum sp.]
MLLPPPTTPGLLTWDALFLQLRIPTTEPAIDTGTCTGTLIFEAQAG